MTFYQIETGKLGEKKAADYLLDKGFTILERNFKTKIGEIDIIASKNKTIYFVEVKSRTNRNKGYPYEAVNKHKLNHIKKAVDYFLLKSAYKDYKLKLAVISILLEKDKVNLKFYDDLE